MGRVLGELRENHTPGERIVLEKLKASLPHDFDIYVEWPISGPRVQRFPDFIVLCTFGVIVLEVKDWIQILELDVQSVIHLDRAGKRVRDRNPVLQAREMAIALAGELERMPELLRDDRKLQIPWGYAVVFPHLFLPVLTQVRSVWGENQVLGVSDLEPPAATKRLKATLPFDRQLYRWELRAVRGVINPTVFIPPTLGRPAAVLDRAQEEIIVEPVRPAPPSKEPAPSVEAEQVALDLAGPTPAPVPTLSAPAGESQPARPDQELPPWGEQLIRATSIRLVRGVAGSGKTLVLTQRARYLAAHHPEWRILVLSYNRSLSESLRHQLRGERGITVQGFHQMCMGFLHRAGASISPQNIDSWLADNLDRFPDAKELGAEFVGDEITWIKEMGIADRQTYRTISRKGRLYALQATDREAIYDVLESYNRWLQENQTCDWGDVPHRVLAAMDAGVCHVPPYNAVLIDEAQDFAPVWFRVIDRVLAPDGLLFLADDPTQSIYRRYSWREKGIAVVGRTRWLRVPYRNTREIYRAAYAVIDGDEVLRRNLEAELGGEMIEPDLANEYMRAGPRPVLRRFNSFEDEVTFIRSEIQRLLQSGLSCKEIAVMHRRKNMVSRLTEALRGLDVEVSTFHAKKGLEYHTVFLSQMQETFPGPVEASAEDIAAERRLVYMAMTRARESLHLNYEGRWPKALSGILPYVDQVN